MVTVIPKDRLVFILALHTKVVVSRYRQTNPHFFEIEHATNWRDLESDARAEAEKQVGALTGMPEYLPCSPDLAARAVFE